VPTVDGLTVKYDSMYTIELVRVNSAVVVRANDCQSLYVLVVCCHGRL